MVKYNKGTTKKLADMLSRPPTSNIMTLGTLMHMKPFTDDVKIQEYSKGEDLKEVYQWFHHQSHVHDGHNTVDYHQYDELLYRLDKICVLKGENL